MISAAIKPKILLDTDPGGDDCLALLWLQSLVHQGHAELVGVTTADGNVDARLTFAGASKVLQLGGCATVEVGRAMPKTASENAAHIHGADGMGNLSQTLPVARQTWDTARSSTELLIEALTGEVTIVAIGPLTNLAIAEQTAPGILRQAKEIVIMGGAVHSPGNITAEAEFNIGYDPEAAAIVFNSGANLVLTPLDVTRQLIFTPEMARSLPAKSAIADFVISLCDFMATTALQYRETQGKRGFLVHDAVTIAYLFYPELFTFRRAQVRIETRGEWTRGKTSIDGRHGAKGNSNAWVGTAVDSANLLAVMLEDLRYLCAKAGQTV
jgi:inosine-uridine nucleoside N-ribohydrolase